MKNPLHNMNPKRRRQLVMVGAVAFLAVVYLRSRGGSSPATDATGALADPNATTLDGTAATGPFAPDWPSGGLGGTGGGGGGGSSSGGTGTTGPPAPKRRPGYKAWIAKHPNATLAERIAALRRFIAQGRGNPASELRLLEQLLRQREHRRHPPRVRRDPPVLVNDPLGRRKRHRGGRGPGTPPIFIDPHPLPGGGGGPIIGIHRRAPVLGQGRQGQGRSSGVARAQHRPPLPPGGYRLAARPDTRKHTLGVR